MKRKLKGEKFHHENQSEIQKKKSQLKKIFGFFFFQRNIFFL